MVKDPRPVSATDGKIVTLSFLTLAGTMLVLRQYGVIQADSMIAAALCIAVYSLFTGALDIVFNRVHERRSSGLEFKTFAPSGARVAVKYLGLLATVAAIGAGYSLFAIYKNDFYEKYWNFLRLIVPGWLIFALPYIYFVDGHMRDPLDGYWQAGQAVLGRWHRVNRRMLGQHALGWLVKAFFLPLMFTYFTADLQRLGESRFSLSMSFMEFYEQIHKFIFLMDVGVVSAGYLMSLRIFDSHLRSAEPTMLGWTAALFCYDPFWFVLDNNYLSRDGGNWQAALAPYPSLLTAVAALHLLLMGIFVWSSVMFGLRFSNLTHRGIITNGPYRWTKHPAYWSKTLAWWLLMAPSLVLLPSWSLAHSCIMLSLICGIYYVRAKTEERHLGVDPDYVAYAQWIERNGLIAKFRNKK
ncbi:MAG TPA: isoprenylcysteine carboxylmethyltransferase family protein [Bdellovibrionales bacterium]|nr:isoprenylcysteine carboxylmethyltransferase family protein [Bdellovibrionales bacterium]